MFCVTVHQAFMSVVYAWVAVYPLLVALWVRPPQAYPLFFTLILEECVYMLSYYLPHISSSWGPALLASPPSAVIRLAFLHQWEATEKSP
jgi:hypothetical protein